jgi:Tol biopolymer transport system component
MGAVRLEIQEAQTESAAGGGAVAGRPARRWWQRGIPWPVVAGMLLVAGAVVVWRFTPAAPASVNRLEMTLPVGDSLARGVALSPNGRTVVYVATRAGVTQLFKRSLGELTATPIPGTAGARSSPLIWPDSDSMTFIVHPGLLKKTRLSGGTPVTLLELRGRQIRGVTIQGRRLILGSHGDGLFQASLEGGTPEPKTSREQASTGPHRDPDAVPGGGVLFRIGAQVTASQIVGLRAGETTWQPIVQGSTPKYLPTGHLMFWRQGSLWVAAFDPATMSLRGDALSVVPNVEIDDGGQATAAWSADGTLAYLPARWGALRSFAIVDARGRETPVSVPPAAYADPVLSPDGTRVLARAAEPAVSSRVFVIDIKPGLAGRLTRDQAVELRYLWAPDSVRVVFSSEGAGLPDLQLTRADRAGTGEPLGIGAASPLGWTADRQGLIYQTPDEAIHVRSLADKTSRQLAPAPPDGLNAARLSPNGRWIAYATGEPGQELVCVRPVPNLTAARFTISAVGGTTPRWHPNGRALFYREGQSIKRISFDPATGPAKGEPVEFVSWPTPGGFDVMSDGRLLLLKNVTPAGAAAPDRVIVIQNWFDEIRRLVPVR